MNGVSRFLSRREKRDRPAHVPSRDAYKIFHEDRYSRTTRDEEKHIQEISKRLEQLEITNIKDYSIKYALHHPYAQGDPDKALELLRLLHETLCGKLIKFNPVIPMVGAENRNMVTCYIDSLLFSMFARVDSFESMLCVKFADAATNNLANLIRLWVNMLRTGKLITHDLVKHMQDALAECGWKEAGLIRQQDVSEAFAFITDKLALPLLTLKMDVYHTGKESSDDHRLVRERLLDVAIPEEPLPDNTPIRLEDCLENFLNNKVEVKRMLQRRNTINSRPVDLPSHAASAGASKSVVKVADSPLFRKSTISQLPISSTPSRNHKDDIDVTYGPKASEEETVTRKEVLLPAWQFFHLIPWFQNRPVADGQLTTDQQVAAHFAKRRPILGICLKRYKQTAEGPKRLDTFIDIPLEMRLPHFIADGSEDDGFGSSFSTFKLSLQSIVCHRGLSLNAGHYISIVRPYPHELSTTNNDHDTKYQWIRHDDLAKDDRVSIVDVRKALKDECPYLLFYQVQLINDDEEYNYATRSSSEFEDLPTYTEALKFAKDDPPAATAAEDNTESSQNDQDRLQSTSSVKHGPVLKSTDTVVTAAADDGHTNSGTPVLQPSVPIDESTLKRTQSTSQLDVATPLRPHSLDIPSAGASMGANSSSRMSQKSRGSTSQRSSINLTDMSNLASSLTTPFDEKPANTDNGLVADTADPHQTKGSISPSKMFTLRRDRQRDHKMEDPEKDKDKDKEAYKSEKRAARSWLTTVNKHTRPKSVPPNADRATVADLMKSFKIGSSKDKLPVTTVVGPNSDVISPETSGESNSQTPSATQSPKLGGAEFDASGKSKKEGKEKLTGLGIGRRKSLRSKNGSRRMSLALDHVEEIKDDPERQCSIM